MMILQATFCISTLLLATAQAKAFFPPMERSTHMDGNGCSNVEWTVNKEAMSLQMAFKSTEGAEWVGLGIAEFGSMKGADIMLVKMTDTANDEPSFVVEDLISTDFAKPRKDQFQNVKLIHAELDDDGKIHALVERPLESCDNDDIAVEPYKQSIICASGYLDDGNDIAYHGPSKYSTTTVNLIIDDDLLFAPLGFSDYASEEIGDKVIDATGIITAHGLGLDPTTALEPIALDIQLPTVTLPENKVSSFFCVAFRIPQSVPFRAVGIETVWGNGQVLDGDRKIPAHIHHQALFQCDGVLDEGSIMEGHSYSCEGEMPICPLSLGAARAPQTQFPPGVHFPLEPKTYVLQVHYENSGNAVIIDDRAGLRVWVEPPLLPSHSTPSKLVYHGAKLSTIHIPADPEQRDYAVHFQISGEASKAVLPPDGVQVLSSFLHMHSIGLRGRLQLIRNGVHVMDIFDTISFDQNNQRHIYKTWKYLPGDTLIMTCVFKPHKDVDTNGGFSDDNEEMCNFFLGMTPPVPGYDIAYGNASPADQLFGKSYIGRSFVSEEEMYEPTYQQTSDYKPLQSQRKKICALLSSQAANTSHNADATSSFPILVISVFGLVFLGTAVFALASKRTGNGQAMFESSTTSLGSLSEANKTSFISIRSGSVRDDDMNCATKDGMSSNNSWSAEASRMNSTSYDV